MAAALESGLGPAIARPRRAAFTLTEVLVVIAIIAIIAALLIPAIGRARALAHRTRCASSLHQVGHGLLVYSTEYRDVLPPSIAWFPGPIGYNWMNFVAGHMDSSRRIDHNGFHYVRLKSVLNGCPTYRPPTSWQLGYSMNHYPDRPAQPAATGVFDYRLADPGGTVFTLAGITHPATRAYISEGHNYWAHSVGYLADPRRMRRHDGGMNVLFFDFHVNHVPNLEGMYAAFDAP